MTPDIDTLLRDRHATHGDYAVHADITQRLKIVMRLQPGWLRLNAMQGEALEMIAHKIGRILAGKPDFQDHWDDIAGYARLVSQRITPPEALGTAQDASDATAASEVPEPDDWPVALAVSLREARREPDIGADPQNVLGEPEIGTSSKSSTA